MASSSAGAKPPSGPTSRAALPYDGVLSGGRGGALDRDKQAAVGRPVGQQCVERLRWMQTRHGQPFALFGGFDGDGCAGELRSPGAYWLRSVMTGEQCGDAEFGRLLHDQVGGIALQQRKDQPKVGFRRLRAQLLVHAETGAVAPDHLDAGSPFAVASVEQVDRVAGPRRMTEPR